ncbi:MAG: DUF4395 domain-containing protein [Bacilli bacterium]
MNNQVLPNSIPQPAVRFNQWVILLSVITSLTFQEPTVLLVAIIPGVISLVFHFHPLIALRTHFLKKPLESYIPEDKASQRFNQWIATILLSLAYLAFYTTNVTVYVALALVVGGCSAVALLGFCIGCFVRYQLLKYKFIKSH